MIVFLSRSQTIDLIKNRGFTAVASSLLVGIVVLWAPHWGMLSALIAVGMQSLLRRVSQKA
jgi:hypothetical protein